MRSLPFPTHGRHGLTLLGALGVAVGCASASKDDSGVLPSLGLADSGVGISVVDAGLRDSGIGPSDGGLNSLCGTADFCGGTPDDPTACEHYDGGTGAVGGGATRDGGLHHGTPDASLMPDGGPGLRDGGADAAMDSKWPDAGSEKEGGTALSNLLPLPVPKPMTPPADAGPAYACQISTDNSGGPIRQCGPSGTGIAGAPCASAVDCRAGFGCVGSGGAEPPSGPGQSTEAGQCLPYCCEAATVCKEGTFCTERPLLDGGQRDKLQVPVCAPADTCTLLEPFPCEGDGCTCPPTLTCAIVRSNGATGCVKPGSGHVGEPCSSGASGGGDRCAAGYYCSLATSTCVKMCKTSLTDSTCSPGKCQATAGFPVGFGLCVGYPPTVQ